MSFNKSRHYHAKYSEEYADSHPLKERDAGFFSHWQPESHTQHEENIVRCSWDLEVGVANSSI
ncbi:hypothetical protein Ahy_B01g057024 isoform F [Arachis hypogaea]|uniref:Uncharacterized protein n=1 Tax=Arachis hypogaea TaxID=3818 RepID=A0A445B042_ARAHY|nr:hypothetical protein Ahy_B01g057024 isoform F [Arachis hypogaea]